MLEQTVFPCMEEERYILVNCLPGSMPGEALNIHVIYVHVEAFAHVYVHIWQHLRLYSYSLEDFSIPILSLAQNLASFFGS